jgi:mono/diheme cytochrome c family protein
MNFTIEGDPDRRLRQSNNQQHCHGRQMKTWIERISTTPTFRALAVIAASCAALNAFAATPGSAQLGNSPAALYHSYCSVCHGDQGNGMSRARASLNPPPSDFTNPAVSAALTRERMIASVREGRPGTAMVGWKTQLSDTQIATIVDYVRGTFMAAAAPPAVVSPAPPLLLPQGAPLPSATTGGARVPAMLKGDKTRGAKLYDQNCVACHGKAGDGAGPRAYFISPKPRSFISAESRAAFTRTILVLSIAQGKRGTEMPSWDKVLSDQEITDVAEYVFQSFIATGNTERK